MQKISDLKLCPCCGGKPKLDSYPGSEWVGRGIALCSMIMERWGVEKHG